MGQIDMKDPAHTYNVCVRVATESEQTARNLSDSLNSLSGRFYEVVGETLGRDEREYERMLSHAITYPSGIDAVRRKKIHLCTKL